MKDESAVTRFGPDPASYIIFFGIIVWTSMCVLLSGLERHLAWLFFVIAMLLNWYSGRIIFVSYVDIGDDYLQVATPLRSYKVSWNSIAKIKYNSKIVVTDCSGAKFGIPQYTTTTLIDLVKKYQPILRKRDSIEAAIKTHLANSNKAKADQSPAVLEWRFPRKWYLVVILSGSVVVQFLVEWFHFRLK